MKGQASLEMVVGLIILLVVAGVVIGLVIHYINPKHMPSPGEKLSITEFLTNCESYCKDMNSLEYCRSYYPGSDWDKNGVRHEIVEVGKYNWATCEDRVYCFLVEPCEDRFGSGLNVMEKCRKLLCQTYLEKYGDLETANKALWDDINFPAVCDMSSVPPEDNWYERVFAQGCASITGTTTTLSQVTLTCTQSGSDLTCTWTGCYIPQGDTGQLMILDAGSIVDSTDILPDQTRCTFTGLTLQPGNTYEIVLHCENDGAYTTVTWQ